MRHAMHAAKIAIYLLGAALLVAALTAMPKRLLFSGGQSYNFYLGEGSKNCRVVTTDGESASITRLTLSDVCGESASYPSDYDWQNLLASLNGDVLFTEELDDSVNYYCKANLPYSVNLYGKEVNLHICVKQSGIMVGSPIIFGGY